MIGPLGYLFAIAALVLGVALYRTQNRAARMETALRARIGALQEEVRRLRPDQLAGEKAKLAAERRDIAFRRRLMEEMDRLIGRLVVRGRCDGLKSGFRPQAERESPGRSAKDATRPVDPSGR